MKKNILRAAAVLAAAILSVSCLSACGASGGSAAGSGPADASAADTEPLQIVTTIFPEYDWVREILGENAGNADLTLLLDNGVDLHSYQPTAEDILKISTCDVFIYVGGESDEWVEDALEQAVNPDMQVIDLLEVLGDAVREEEVVEGMQEEEHDHDEAPGDHDHDEEHEEGPEYDEHVWLSLKNAQVICEAVCDALSAADPANADAYAANTAAYTEQLAALDEEYADAAADAARDTVLFADRFPFRYLTDDYGLTYYAAFVGCSAETEASFETIRFLSEKVDELALPCILIIEGSDGSIAATVAENAAAEDVRILTMNSLQSVTASDLSAGVTYLSVMRDNLEVLREALS